MARRPTRFLPAALLTGAVLAAPAVLPLLHTPLVDTPRQQFTPAERQSLNTLIRFLNTPATQPPGFRTFMQEHCGQIRAEDALLSITAPFRTSQPEKLEVVMVCGGEGDGVALAFTRNGQRTIYLLPPVEGGGGMTGIQGAYTLRDINSDGRRELVLMFHAGGVETLERVEILTFNSKGPQHYGRFETLDQLNSNSTEASGRAQVLRVQKGAMPIVFAYEQVLNAQTGKWNATGKVTRTALLTNPIHFLVWPASR